MEPHFKWIIFHSGIKLRESLSNHYEILALERHTDFPMTKAPKGDTRSLRVGKGARQRGTVRTLEAPKAAWKTMAN